MHYYKFNVADWVMNTSHLSLEEEAVYLRLVNHYYDSEQPIPLETHSVTRRLRLGSHSETVDIVLKEFFIKTDEGWIHSKCEKLLAEYHARAERNRQNGSKGGRKAKKDETENKPSGLEVGSQKDPTLVNHKLLTTNQELEANKDPIVPSKDETNPTSEVSDSSKSKDYPDEFEFMWNERPRRQGTDAKRKAFHACNARLRESGATWRELAEGLRRYYSFCKLTGKLSTEHVMMTSTFFGPDEHYKNEWKVNHGTTQQGNAGPGRKLTRVEENNARLLEKYGDTTPPSERSINQLDDTGVDEYEVSGSLREQVGLSGVTIDMGSGDICDDGATDQNCSE